MVKAARDFAINAHGDQLYGDEPYVVHLDEVAAIVRPYGELAEIIAYLHDTAEDTMLTIEDIGGEFTMFIATCVYYLTDEEGKTRRERKRKTNHKLSRMPSEFNITKVVKAADRLVNLRRGGKNDMYAKEHPEFRQAVFVDGLCNEIWEEIERCIYVA